MLKNGLEPWHLILILVVCLLLFGSQKLPDSARSLGQALRAFKAETRATSHDDEAPAHLPAIADTASAATAGPTPTSDPGRNANTATEDARGLD